MSKVIEKPATYEDLLRIPDYLVAEIIDGELITSPRPAVPHANAAGVLHSELHRRLQRGDGCSPDWWFLIEPELHLGDDVLVPDVAGWRKEHMPQLPDAPAIDVAPDWVCEVISVKTALLDRARKLPRYARNGVPWAWIVDPVMHTIEIYQLESDRNSAVVTVPASAAVVAEPFAPCQLDLSDLWLPVTTPPSPQSSR